MKKQKRFLTKTAVYLCLLVATFIQNYASFGQSTSKKDSLSILYKNRLNTLKKDHDSIAQFYNIGVTKTMVEKYLTEYYYTKIIPCWLGTKWEFYGETQIPGDSSIACGHFVVTTLKHLGFNLENSHEMATNFSAYMVNSLCDSSYKVYKPEELIAIVQQRPDDVWVVGLHNHSGLLIKYNGKIRFVHSSYTYPTMVIDEPADESHTFKHSSIYVAGNLFKNNSLTEKWIKGEEVKYTKKY